MFKGGDAASQRDEQRNQMNAEMDGNIPDGKQVHDPSKMPPP